MPLFIISPRAPRVYKQGMQNSINKDNSQYSTGPRTPEGKEISSMNALTHGLTSRQVVMPSEDAEAYRLHVKSFSDEYDPQGATEANLVQSIADSSWRINRVVALEAGVEDCKALSNLSMHSQRLARQFEKAVTQLRDLQKIRRELEKTEMDGLLKIMEMKGPTYDPAKDGFVFSAPQIRAAKLALRRERLTMEAICHPWTKPFQSPPAQ